MILEEDGKSTTTKAYTNAKISKRGSHDPILPIRSFNYNHNIGHTDNLVNNLQVNVENSNPDIPEQDELDQMNQQLQQQNQPAQLLHSNHNPLPQNTKGTTMNPTENLQISNLEPKEKELKQIEVRDNYLKYLNYIDNTSQVKFCPKKVETLIVKVNRRDLLSLLSNSKEELISTSTGYDSDDEEKLKNHVKSIILNIDGNENSHKALNLLTTKILTPSLYSKFQVIGSYIYDEKNDGNYNFANRKDTVIEVNTTRLTATEVKNIFVIEEKRELDPEFIRDKDATEFNQTVSLAHDNKADYLVSAYTSLKGPLGSNKVQDENLDNLLLTSSIPVMLLKEFHGRFDTVKGQKRRGYRWFILLDHSYINCFKAFTAFSEFIDKKNDHVHAYGAYPSYITYDVYQKQFTEYCQHYGFLSYSYESEAYVKKVSKVVLDKVNYESEEGYDYIVFYNNCDRHFAQKQDSESWKILKKTHANICFINNLCV